MCLRVIISRCPYGDHVYKKKDSKYHHFQENVITGKFFSQKKNVLVLKYEF